MEYKLLQNTVLEQPYNREIWYKVLKEYFGVKNLQTKPKEINVDRVKAEYAVELGHFYTSDEREVGIFEVKLTPEIWLERNRVGVRSLLRQVYKDNVDAALIVFVQDEKWRFSYVSEIRTLDGKKETEPKRYTYLLGKGEICRTAAERFAKLKNNSLTIHDLFEAFNVEKLNKDFFKRYKEFHETFWRYLADSKSYSKLLIDKREEDEERRNKPIRDFSKKLLGRIVFLHFLQKKGWMGTPQESHTWNGGDIRFLQNLFINCKDKSLFHSKELKTLFFETLNTKRNKDVAPAILGKNIKIPFLNGGLFDSDISYEHDFDFPNSFFADLLDFFEQYNFTIDENDPYDSEVGIDPEMLGHIFENLLEENREKGAFYTPKEIVHYMCQESLIEYLCNSLPEYEKDDFELLIRNKQVSKKLSNYKNADEVTLKLKKVKICDPAIGSGAFPMGLLKEIFDARRLLYGFLRSNEAFSPAMVKKEIIQENIYGVDVENGAVEIARLRFWLALVVDEAVPQPLPNLDYKIMQGNSLLESFNGVDLSNLTTIEEEETLILAAKGQYELGVEFSSTKQALLVFDEKTKEQLYELIHDYYNFDENGTKSKYVSKQAVKDDINRIVEGKLLAKFYLEKPKIQKRIDDCKDKLGANRARQTDTIATIKKKEKNIEKLTKEIGAYEKELQPLNDTIEHLHELQTSSDKPYFLWHLWFKDVFDSGGFDIVIGNPPYIQLQKLGQYTNKLSKAGYETFERTGDIYCLFYEHGNNLLRKNGVLCYITSNKWMRAAYGERIRRYFTENLNPIILIDFAGIQIFESATVDTNIMVATRSAYHGETKTCTVKNDYGSRINLSDYFRHYSQPIAFDAKKNWVLLSRLEQEIKKKIEMGGIPLKDWDISIYRGILTGYNDAFIINQEIRDKLVRLSPKNETLIRPILRGRDIQKYKAAWGGNYIIVSHTGYTNEKGERIEPIDINKYPAVKQHLDLYWDDISARQDQGITPYNLRSCIYMEDFSKHKIIWKRIGSILRFAYDESGLFCLDSTCFATGNDVKFLTGYLNSTISRRELLNNSPKTGTGDVITSVQALEPLRIPKTTPKEKQQIELLVDKCIQMLEENPNANITQLENQIDSIVFKLFGFNEEEISFIKQT